MAEENKENVENVGRRVTRASKKRSAAMVAGVSSSSSFANSLSEPPPQKRRVVLGELTNFSDSSVGNRGKIMATASAAAAQGEDKKRRGKKLNPVADSSGGDLQYASEIYQYLRQSEAKRRPIKNYMESVQTDVTANMRSILVDWLVEVAEEYRLVPDTLFLTVAYIDRFLSANALNRQKLQLLGVSCMLIAAKYEEISPPHVEDFCYITDNTYTKEEVVQMERQILQFLNFEMCNPTIKTFLRRFTMAAQGKNKNPNVKLEFLCSYLAELSLLEYGCLEYVSSQIAASVLFLAKFTLHPKSHPWNSVLQDQSGYKPSDLKDCVNLIHSIQLNRKQSNVVAIRDKYNQDKFKSVSLISPLEEIPARYFED